MSTFLEAAYQKLMLPVMLAGATAKNYLGNSILGRAKAVSGAEGKQMLTAALGKSASLLPENFIPSPNVHLADLTKLEAEFGQNLPEMSPMLKQFLEDSLKSIQQPHDEALTLSMELEHNAPVEALHRKLVEDAMDMTTKLVEQFNQLSNDQVSFLLSKLSDNFDKALNKAHEAQHEAYGEEVDAKVIEAVLANQRKQRKILIDAYNRRILDAITARQHQIGTQRFKAFHIGEITSQFKAKEELGADLSEFDVSAVVGLRTPDGVVIGRDQQGHFSLSNLRMKSRTERKAFMRELVLSAITVARNKYITEVNRCKRATPPEDIGTEEDMIKIDIRVEWEELALYAYEALDNYNASLGLNIQCGNIKDIQNPNNVFPRDKVYGQARAQKRAHEYHPVQNIVNKRRHLLAHEPRGSKDTRNFQDLKASLEDHNPDANSGRPTPSTSTAGKEVGKG